MTKYLLQGFIPNAYMYVILLMGITLAVIRRKKHPQVSVCVIVAISFLILNTFIGQGHSAAASYYVLENSEEGLTLIGYYAKYIRIIPYSNTIAWTLILFSVFGWRSYQRPATDTDAIKENS